MYYIWIRRQSWSDKYVLCILFCLLSQVYRVWNGLTGMFRPWRVELVHGNPVYGYYVSSLQVWTKWSYHTDSLSAGWQDRGSLELEDEMTLAVPLRLELYPGQHLLPSTQDNQSHCLCNLTTDNWYLQVATLCFLNLRWLTASVKLHAHFTSVFM